MTSINWISMLHHGLTVLGFIMMPALWLALNFYGERTTFVTIFKTWNDTRKSGEPWGWFDRGYRA